MMVLASAMSLGMYSGVYAQEDLVKEEPVSEEALVEVDPNLITLKDFVKECKAIAYDNYTRESWQNLGAAIAQAEEELNKNLEAIDEDVFNALYDSLQEAKDGLVKASSFGAEYGIDEYWLKKSSANDGTYVYEGNSKVRGGQLYVSGEVVNGDGTTTLMITWINNGINPVNGGLFRNTYYGSKTEYSLRPFTESDWEQNDEWWIDVSGCLITMENVPDLYLTPDEYDGCTKTVVVPTGTTVDLELQSWGNIGSSAHDTARTYSLGTYYTLKNTSVALQEALEKAEEIIADGDAYAQDENWNAFMEVYQNANAVLEKGQEDQFAYIPSEEIIGEKRMLTVEAPEGKEFKGWNTTADGTGTTITTESKLTEDTVVYPIFASTVDKSELQKLYDEVKDTQSDVISFKYFTTSLNKAKTVLEDENATQDEVDKAKIDLEARYYAVKVQELNEIYNPENEFNFMDYTTESLVPVINMWGITHNRTNGNYQENEIQGNIGQMKDWYEEYLDAIEGLQKAGEDAVYIGITNESSKTNKEQGSFEIVSAERVYVDGEEKVKLVVNFNNTGIHPIYGEELPNANGATEFKKLGSINDKTSFRYQGYDDGKHMISAGMNEKTKLPGVSSWYSGVQGVCYIDSNINHVTFSVDNEIYSSWIYRVPELPEPADTIAPEVTVTTSNNGQPTNQSVKVTITANEAIQDIEGWTRVNETTLERVYDANTSENMIVTDIAGNTTKTNVVVEGIDKTAPKADVTYEITEDGVLVTIKADEAVQDVEGWTKVDDQTLQKLFTENGIEEVIVQDAVGNQTMVTVTVDSIDKESPIVKVEYDTTPEGVQVTITANEPIQTPEGWTKASDTVFTKLYTENTEEKITIYDLSGNSTDITIFVTGIGSETGEETKPGEEGKPGDSEKPQTEDAEKTDGEDTAANMYAGIFGGLMAAAVAGLGVLGLLKRKKK